jgi:hypothetical protein
MKIARVFPRKTNGSPTDELAFFDYPPMLDLPEVDEVHVSCTFTYDRAKAEQLARAWKVLGVPVKVGGPAYNDQGGEFTPELYLKKGYVITSRGCNNNCWFCSVPKREGKLRELEIKDGWVVADNNLLQCSVKHILNVFEMLLKQPYKAEFTGGLEAKLLKFWHVELFKGIKPKSLYFAYDTPDDLEPLIEAGKLLKEAEIDIHSRIPMCYVLVGYRGDTFEKAEKRLTQTLDAGFIPFAMLYKDEQGNENKEWRKFSRNWVRPILVYMRHKGYFKRGDT